jgi:hypothetical protein
MDLAAALQITIDLAKQNILTDDQAVGGMEEEQAKQQEAVKIVEDFTVNHVGDD